MTKVDFEHGSIASNILQTALPMFVAQVLSLLYNIVDRIYIGRIPQVGTQALGAVGLCFPVITLILGFTNMFGMGGSPLFSMAYGRKNRQKAAAILNSSFRLLLLCGIVITVCGEIFAVPLLRLFGATQAELGFAAPYLHLYLIGTVFSMLGTGMNPFINAQGFAAIGMFTVAVGAVANLILDPVFIFVFGLGVSGAAIATVLSQLLSAAFVMNFLLGKKNEFRLTASRRIEARDDDGTAVCQSLPFYRDIIGLGMAPFIMCATNSLVTIACNTMLMKLGGAMFVSAMTVISSVRQILDTPILAIADGASPTISYNYGARRPDRVKRALLIMTVIAMGYTFVMWMLIERLPQLFLSLFTADAELQSLAARPLHLYFYAFVFQSFQYSGQTTFKALGKKKQAVFFSLLRKVIFVVPLTCLLPYAFGLGTDGVFMAEPVSNVAGGLACFTTMLLTVLPELNRMEGGNAPAAAAENSRP